MRLRSLFGVTSIELPPGQRKYVELLRTNLEEIASPFVNRLSNTYFSLSPTEISICNMIRSGLRTKEIARMRGVTAATIDRHREHIRRKLKITNSEVNLMTYLQSSQWKGEVRDAVRLDGVALRALFTRPWRQARRFVGKSVHRFLQWKRGKAKGLPPFILSWTARNCKACPAPYPARRKRCCAVGAVPSRRTRADGRRRP